MTLPINTMNTFKLILPAILVLFLGCKKLDKPGSLEIKKEKISGYIQKGPFLNGTQISMYELDSKLAQTGKVFNVTITV